MMTQLDQEVRSILDGSIDVNSRVAKTLGITNAQVKLERERGTLQQFLNEKLEGNFFKYNSKVFKSSY